MQNNKQTDDNYITSLMLYPNKDYSIDMVEFSEEKEELEFV